MLTTKGRLPASYHFSQTGVPARSLRSTVQPVDTGTAAGKAFLDMLGVSAEFETNLRRERQLEGIALGKTRGVYKGRKPSIHVAEVRRLRDEERLGPAAIARRLGIGRANSRPLRDPRNAVDEG
jgi:DNA invertase Pin-like site-specific DNA recombinase